MIYRECASSSCLLSGFMSRLSAIFFCFFLYCVACARTFASRFCDVIVDSVVILWFRTSENTLRTIYIQSCPHLNRMHDFRKLMMMMFAQFALKIRLPWNLTQNQSMTQYYRIILGFHFIVMYFAHTNT